MPTPTPIRRSRRPPPSSAGSPGPLPCAGYLLTLLSHRPGVVFVLSTGGALLDARLVARRPRRATAGRARRRGRRRRRWPSRLPGGRSASAVTQRPRSPRASVRRDGRRRSSPCWSPSPASCARQSVTLARFTDPATSAGSFAPDTLAPPTGSAATGGTTRRPDLDRHRRHLRDRLRRLPLGDERRPVHARRDGHARGPPSTTTDSPGRRHLVLRPALQSPGRGRASTATRRRRPVGGPRPRRPTRRASPRRPTRRGAGDNDGYQTNPARACVDDSSTPRTTGSGTGGTASCGTGATPDADQGPPSVLGLRDRAAGDGHVHRRHPGPGRPRDEQQRRHDEPVRPAVVGRRDDLDDDQVPGVVTGTADDLHVRVGLGHLGPDLDRRRSFGDNLSGSGSSTPRPRATSASSSTTSRSASPTARRRHCTVTRASRSTRGCPAVPSTTILTVRDAEDVQEPSRRPATPAPCSP